MDSITKFNGIDYTNTFAKRISVMHELVKNVLSGHLNKDDEVIDIGGGPGIGAKKHWMLECPVPPTAC